MAMVSSHRLGLERRVEGDHLPHVDHRDLEQRGQLRDHLLGDPAPTLLLDEVQRGQEHGSLLGVLRKLPADPLRELGRQWHPPNTARECQRSHSPPIMLIMSNVGTTSANMAPWTIRDSACVFEKLGERARHLYGFPDPSLTR